MAADWRPLLELRRAGIPEVLVHGAVAWASADARLHAYGGDPVVFGRSLVKPLQIAPFARRLLKHFDSSTVALGCASHNAEPEHLAVLAQLRDRALDRALALPASKPLVQRPGGPKHPSPLLHPCSGKHAALLQACRLEGFEEVDYTSAKHPLHLAYLDEVKNRLGPRWKPKAVATDGCGLPTLTFRLSELARLFASLAVERRTSPVWKAMTAHPFLVGGTGRLDTGILLAGGGRVLAKEGADGLLALGIAHRAFPRGLGVVVKIAHGWAPEPTRFVASRILESVGVRLPAPPAPHGQTPVLPAALVMKALR